MHKLEIRGERMTQLRGRSSHSPRSLAASAEHGSATAERADTGWFEGKRRHGWWRRWGGGRLSAAGCLHFRPRHRAGGVSERTGLPRPETVDAHAIHGRSVTHFQVEANDPRRHRRSVAALAAAAGCAVLPRDGHTRW